MKRIYVIDEKSFGDAVDVTDAMAALYDLAIGSMDYGSGFWTYEDAVPVAEMAELMGWEGREGIVRYRDQQKFKAEQSVWAKDITGTPSHNIYLYGPEFVHYEVVTRTSADGSTFTGNDPVSNPHEHVYGTTDQCFWPYCKVEREH